MQLHSQVLQLEVLLQSKMTLEKSISTRLPSDRAVTAPDITTAAVNTAAAAASTVAPTPAAAANPSANPVVPQAATSAVTVTDVVESAIQAIQAIGEIAGVAVGLLIAPIWYLAFPITIPISYQFAQGIWSVSPFPPTNDALALWTAGIFLAAPFLLGPALVTNLVNQVGSWLRSVFPAATAQATAAVGTASTGTSTPTADKPVGRVTTTVNALKGRIGATGLIPRTVAPKQTDLPKPLGSATTDGPVAGEPQVPGNEPSADSGLLRAAVTSTTSDLKKAVKHDTGIVGTRTEVTSTTGNLNKAVKQTTGTIGKKAQDSQNSTVRSGAARTRAH